MKIGHARFQSWSTLVVDKYRLPFKQPVPFRIKDVSISFPEIGKEAFLNITSVQKATETIVEFLIRKRASPILLIEIYNDVLVSDRPAELRWI